VGYGRTARLVSAVTGWNATVFELMKIGERAMNLARLFNIREGFSSKDDSMPERFFTPQDSGPLEGINIDKESFLKARNLYYDMMNWKEGVPSEGKLGELGIDGLAVRP
jgi:aldehyde:ferredoxin oxidoreductase